MFADACLWVQEADAPPEVLRRANDAARLLLKTSCSYCAVRQGELLRLVAHSGFRDPRTAQGWRLPVGQGIGGRVVARGETLVVRDYQHDPRRERFSKSLIDAEGLRCSIAVPIRSGERVVGVLYAAEHRLRRFSAGEVEAMSLFGRLVGAALAAAEERQALRQRLAGHEEAGRQAAEARGLFDDVGSVLGGGGTLEGALGVLVGRLGGAAAVLDAFGHRLAAVGEPGQTEEADGAAEPGGAGGAEAGEAGQRVSVPIPAGDRRLGTLALAPARPLGPALLACLEQVAELIALSLLREQSMLQEELGPGSRLLDELLGGSVDEAAVRHRASLLGVDLAAPRAVLCVGHRDRPGGQPRPAMTRAGVRVLRRLTAARRLEPLLDLRGGDLVVLIRAGEGGMAALRTAVAGALREAGTVLRGAPLVGGLGRPRRGVDGLAASYREAAMALELARAGAPDVQLRTCDELGFAGLLAGAVELQALDTLARRTLGPLLEADRVSGRRYVATLAAYLSADRHLKPAAAALGVHVNTLRYRIARIERLLGVRLDDVDARFSLELAVRVGLRPPATPHE
jgi:sugar diacid utilization regulator/putative methionine-R-sulfoxide reductase with GAF domain